MADVTTLPSPTESPTAADYTAFQRLPSGKASTAGLADDVSKTGQRVKRMLFEEDDNISATTQPRLETDPDQPAAKRRCCHNEQIASHAVDSFNTDSCSQRWSSSGSCHDAATQGQAAAAPSKIVQEHQQQAGPLQQQQQPKGLTSPLKLRFKLIKTEAGTTVSWCHAAAGCNNSSTSSSSTCCFAGAGAQSSAVTRCCESTSAAAAATVNSVPEQQQQQQWCNKANARRASLAVVRGYISKYRNSRLARKQLQRVLSKSAVAEQLTSAGNNLQQQQQQEPVQDADVLLDTAAAAAAPQAGIYVSRCTVCDKGCHEYDDDEHDCQHCGAHWGLKQLQSAEQQQYVGNWLANRILDEDRGYARGDQNRGVVCLQHKVEGKMPPKSRLGLASRFA